MKIKYLDELSDNLVLGVVMIPHDKDGIYDKDQPAIQSFSLVLVKAKNCSDREQNDFFKISVANWRFTSLFLLLQL